VSLLRLVGEIPQLAIQDVGSSATSVCIRQPPDATPAFKVSIVPTAAMLRTTFQVLNALHHFVNSIRNSLLTGGQIKLEKYAWVVLLIPP
jgi:hypothetical protein